MGVRNATDFSARISTAAVSLHEKTITDEKSDSEFGQAVRSVTETTVEATVTEDTAAEEPEWSLPQLQGRVIFGTPNLDG